MTRRNFLIFIFALALVQGIAFAIGDDWQAGARSFAIVMGFWLLVCFIPSTRLELLRPGHKDERQTSLGMEALAITGVVLVAVVLSGAWYDATQGRTGTFAMLCAVGGATFLIASLALPRRR